MKLLIRNLHSDIKKLNIVFFIIFSSGLLFYKLLFHELWKDEWQAWLVSKNQGLIEMLTFLNYEGHPSLWYLYLKFWSYLPGDQEILLQLSHVLLVFVALYLLFTKIRLPTFWKLLISLSYFLVFEYGVINRGYILVVILSFFSIVLVQKNKYNWSLGLSILLLCQTEVYGVIIAGAILVYIIVTNPLSFYQTNGSKAILSWAIGGMFLFIITVFPRGNENDFSRAYNQQSITLETIHESIQGHLANVFTIGVIDDTASNGATIMGLFLSIGILIIILFIFSRDKKSMTSMILSLLGFILFGIFIFAGGVRQWGMVYLSFVAMLALSHSSKSDWNNNRFIFVTLLMVAPVIHGINALITDYQIPFSNAKEAGLFIKDKVPSNVPIIVINKFETAPVGAYAGRALYELPSGEKFTYFKWLEKVYIPTQSEINLFTKYKNIGGIVLLSPNAIDSNRFPSAQLWKKLTAENFKRDNYWLYSIPLYH